MKKGVGDIDFEAFWDAVKTAVQCLYSWMPTWPTDRKSRDHAMERYFTHLQGILDYRSGFLGLQWSPYTVFASNINAEDVIVPDWAVYRRGSRELNTVAFYFHVGKLTKKGLMVMMDNLRRLTTAEYGFRYSVGIVLTPEKASLFWFANGKTLPVSYEDYKTKTWESLSPFFEEKTSARRRTCTLMVTRACNLNCKYCYEPFKCNDKSKNMTFDTAKEILLKEFAFVKKSKEFEEIEIDFMGGEPLMNFPLIKRIVEWLEHEPPPVPYICFATTNGTLVPRYEKWLRAHTEHFQLGASYDGTIDMQRKNRGADAKQVDLALIHDIYPRQGFHMVVSRETLSQFADGVLEIQRKGYKLVVALAQGEEWTVADAVVYRQQLEKLAHAYLGRDKRLMPINLLTRPCMTIADDPKTVSQKKYCGTGTHMVTYDYDGKMYGCHLFTPVVLGDNAREIKDIDYKCADDLCDPYCVKCRLKGVCPTCAGFNYRYRGGLGSRDHRWCCMVLTQMKVACSFQIKRIARDQYHTQEEIAHAKCAVEAYQVLQQISHKAIPPYVV